MSKPTGLEKERQGLKGIPQVARKSPTSWQKLGVLCSASGRRRGPGASSLPRRPPGHPLEAADVRAQLTPNYLHPAHMRKKAAATSLRDSLCRPLRGT